MTRLGPCSLLRIALCGLLASLSLGACPGLFANSNQTSVGPNSAGLRVLFLGDRGHHQPRARYQQIQPVLAGRGIELTYTEDMGQLALDNLRTFDALLVYANIDTIAPEQARAVLDYVRQGGGFVPLHCATYCFRNAPEMVALMGGQFQRHGTGVFRTEIVERDHPIMKGFGGFESWDETYVHHLHNEKNRTVLSYRVDDEGQEPWTWVRTEGRGRVFYTAWGHDARTWGNPGFQNLLERGIRWAAGRALDQVPSYLADQAFPVPQMNPLPENLPPFKYIDVGAKIPNYTPGQRWGTQGEARSLMQAPLPAEQSMKHLTVPVGFRVELFVSDPDLQGKPIAMAWDERGRLWVAETYDYPNELQPPGQGRDRIRICEDTDGDWRADKFTVFATELSIPTSLTFYRGGVLVQDGTETIYLKDLDGDDVADQRTVVFTGWNQGDTHGGVSNFQYGLDNWIWAMQGYNNSRPRSEQTSFQSFRQGFFRFRGDGSAVEFIRSTNNNTWGLGISEEGLIFGSTANRVPSVFMPIPNRYYEQVRGWAPSLVLDSIADTFRFKPITDKVRQVDQHGGYTAGAGHALYTARNYPSEYWNRTAFVNGPTGHLVGTFVLKPSGSDFRSTSPFNLLASDDEWTAPIMSEVGPDGNVWVIDWYNYIVQHNPTPQGFKTGRGNAYETDLRDKKHGRIYRVVYDEAGPAKPFRLESDSPQQWVETLSHPTMLWRKHAQRLLVERGKRDVVPALVARLEDTSVDAIGLNVGVIHCLWTLQGLNAIEPNSEVFAAVAKCLSHPSPGVRRNAVQVLPRHVESTRRIVAAETLADSDAQVRLASFLAMSDLPATADSAAALVQATQLPQNQQDRWIPEASVSAAANHGVLYLKSVAGLDSIPEATLRTSTLIAGHLARGPNAGKLPQVLADLASAPTELLTAILQGVDSARLDPDTQWALSAEVETRLEALFPKLPAASQGLLIKLAAVWGSKRLEKFAAQMAEKWLATLHDESNEDEVHLQAARELLALRPADPKTANVILELITPRRPQEFAAQLLNTLSRSKAPGLGAQIVERYPLLTPSVRGSARVIMLQRPELTSALLDGADQGIIPLSELTLDQKQALAAHPNAELRARAKALLERGGAFPSPDRQKVITQMLPVIHKSGDALAGKEVFKKQCAKCHQHRGEGEAIGPDLTGMAVHPKEELLIHILDPSRSVEGNFRVYSVQTVDGVVLTGLLASESRTAIELFDSEGKKRSILRDDIEQLKASDKSLMPEGFEKQVTPSQLNDLLEFLTERGRFVPADMRKAVTISSDRGMFNSRDSEIERLVFRDWSPKMVGDVPFYLIDPRDGRVANCILLQGPQGAVCRSMPRQVELPCGMPVDKIHLLSGVSGWGHPLGEVGSVSMIVRLTYDDGQTEDHPLQNGIHFADYIRRVDVPQSQFAFSLRGQQIRYLTVAPQRSVTVKSVQFIKGEDRTSPLVMAVTYEPRTSK